MFTVEHERPLEFSQKQPLDLTVSYLNLLRTLTPSFLQIYFKNISYAWLYLNAWVRLSVHTVRSTFANLIVESVSLIILVKSKVSEGLAVTVDF
jgi:hypothetical protein